MDLLKDYGCEIKYHPGAANLTIDALSLKVRVSALQTGLVTSIIEDCCSSGYTFKHKKGLQSIHMSAILSEPSLYYRIQDAQMSDPKTHHLARLARDDSTSGFHYQSDGFLCFSSRIVVLKDDTLREEILSQAHRSKSSIHPGSNKMEKDLRTRFG
ncbi:uncharacterized protein [Henckelia pumila]|uniref:uncharacterized protein n=1 Tax=Henckelia pumila TaxID=405737 RepID=UPI003C6E222C